MSQPFILGVNYWPRRKAMYWWSDFDAGEVREEFSLIHELGMTMVRIFLLWDDFQPAPDEVSLSCLKNLVTVCDIAALNNLQLNITFFTGNMSGASFAPHWMLRGGRKPLLVQQVVSQGKVVNQGYLNPYSDETVLAAQKYQIRTIVSLLKDHSAVGLWNLGNEPDVFARPRNDRIGDQWASDMASVIKAIDPHHPVTCGLHIANLLWNNGLRIDQVFSHTDLSVMHAYPMYARKLARGPLDPDYVPFTCALTAALSGKPVLMEEFGGCTAPPGKDTFEWRWTGYGRTQKQIMVSEESLAEYFSLVLPRLVEVGVIGALAWCFADYDPSLWDRPPLGDAWHERYFGLVRPDGSLKLHAEEIRKFAKTNPVVMPARKTLTLTYPSSAYYKNTLIKLLRLYRQWTSAATETIVRKT